MEEIIIQKEKLLLLKDRAAIWKSRNTLLLADLHIGKVSHFRKNGIPVPDKAGQNNLWRLSNVLLDHKPDRVIFLGDLFHSHINASWDIFADFLEAFSKTEFILVKGNHDILPVETFEAAGLEVYDELREGPFLFTHDRVESDLYNIHGHIHPGVRLRGGGRQSLVLPCFYFSKKFGVFPSFGDFTGLYKLRPTADDRVFVTSGVEVLAVK